MHDDGHDDHRTMMAVIDETIPEVVADGNQIFRIPVSITSVDEPNANLLNDRLNRTTRRMEQRMEHQQQTDQRQEISLGITLVSISVLFIICQSLKVIPDLYEIWICKPDEKIGLDCPTTPMINELIRYAQIKI